MHVPTTVSHAANSHIALRGQECRSFCRPFCQTRDDGVNLFGHLRQRLAGVSDALRHG